MSDINCDKRINIKIRKDDVTTDVKLLSLSDYLQNESMGTRRVVALTKHLNEIDSIMAISNVETAQWYKLSLDTGRPLFVKCGYKELAQYKEITYIKLFFNNSFLFVPPNINSDPFMYNGDRQRSFNLLSERIISAYDYTLKDFLDDNSIEYPPLEEIPPAYIGKFCVYNKNGEDVFFIRKNIHINDPEPNGGILLVGESYFDTVYVRNVRIPHFNIVIPEMIYMANNNIMPKIKKLIVNVTKEGVNPILNRSDMEKDDKSAISYAVGYSILKYYTENDYVPSSMGELIGELYSENNEFIIS